jgi:hypothetical protein
MLELCVRNTRSAAHEGKGNLAVALKSRTQHTLHAALYSNVEGMYRFVHWIYMNSILATFRYRHTSNAEINID